MLRTAGRSVRRSPLHQEFGADFEPVGDERNGTARQVASINSSFTASDDADNRRSAETSSEDVGLLTNLASFHTNS